MSRNKIGLIILLLPALLCRAMIPAGFMPRTADHFSVTLKICPGHLGHHAGDSAPRPNAPAQDHPCIYSAGPASAPPAVLLAVVAPIAAPDLLVAFTPSSDTGFVLARANLARGPPRLA